MNTRRLDWYDLLTWLIFGLYAGLTGYNLGTDRAQRDARECVEKLTICIDRLDQVLDATEEVRR